MGTKNGGTSFVGMLTLMFIVLKLTNVIDWSWWWVLSPSLIGILFMLIVLTLYVFMKDDTNTKS